jgi:hypothetical protein
VRYHVRNQQGEELVVPSLADLHCLYTHGFIDDEDYVRADNAERWVKAGRMPALAGVRVRQREPGRLLALILAAIAFVAIAVGALRYASPLMLIFAAIVFAVAIALRRQR